MKKEKLWAMPDEGHCDGDSGFYYPDNLVPYKTGETFDDLVKKVRNYCVKSLGSAPDEVEQDFIKDLRFFMVITDQIRKIINAGVPRNSVGSDSMTYYLNSCYKRMCKKAAVKVMKR